MGKDETQTPASDVVKLSIPVEFGDDRITEVKVRRPKGKDMKGLKDLQNNTDEQLKLVARLIDQPTSFVDELDFVDIEAIMNVVVGFLDRSRRT